MGMTIRSDDELDRFFRALAEEIVSANIYNRLRHDVIGSIQDYREEFAQSNAFWHLIISALNDARILYLCRVYDQHQGTLSIYNLLMTIAANPQYFGEAFLKRRLADNPYLDSDSRSAEKRVPPAAQLQKDIQFSSNENPLVKKLTAWRGNAVAHKGANFALGKTGSFDKDPIRESDVEELLDGAYAIINRYLGLYRNQAYSRQMIGHDDYMSLLNMVRIGLRTLRGDNE